jgi:amino acid adenylation domain-containing protein
LGLLNQEKSFGNKQEIRVKSTRIESDKLIAAAQRKSSEEHFWLDRLAGDLNKAVFPYDFQEPSSAAPDRTLQGYEFNMDGEVYTRMMEVSNCSDVRIYIILLSVLAVLLNKYTQEEDIILGAPIYKQEMDVQFINTVLPLRIDLSGGPTVKELLLRMGQVLMESTKNQNYPVETLLYQLNIPYSQDDDFPLFDIAVLLENIHQRNYLNHIRINMCFSFNRTDSAVTGNLEYNPLLCSRETVQRITAHYVYLLENALLGLDTPCSQLDILSGEERERILSEFNATAAQYPADQTIYSMFEQQAKRTPEHLAVLDAATGSSLTYSQLEEQSSRLAAVLVDHGVVPGTLVAIMAERSPEMIVGLYGILKAGAAYLPIDPEYPRERMDYMLTDSGAALLLTGLPLPSYMIVPGTPLPHVSVSALSTYAGSLSLERARCTPASLAYIIYTSGSTGKPKGVAVQHRPVINRLHWMQARYPIGETDSILQKTSFTFDVSVWELFWWSQQGTSVCLLKPRDEISPAAIVETIEAYNVTTLHFVPSMMNFFLGYLEESGDVNRLGSLRQVFSSGEALLANHVERFGRLFENHEQVKLANLYGPTEATVDVSYFDCDSTCEFETVPIGKPIDNIRLYIVDNSLRLLPVGVTGELCIAGDGLACGYLNKPALTAEKFVPNPFSSGDRLYKTGDLSRWLPDGNIAFLGRKDHQVKLRGYRVELGEIESLLLDHEEIKEAVVIAKADSSEEGHLCAYIVPEAGESDLKVSRLRKYLALKLPEYMIPSYFIPMTELPVTTSGKIDRKSLPEPSGSIDTGVEYVEPGNDLEKIIAGIWKEVLNLGKVSVMDSFFELGGTSVKIIQVNSKMKEVFQREIPIMDMFRHTTISALAEHLKDDGAVPPETIEIREDKRIDAETRGKDRAKNLRQKMRNG